MESKSLKAAYLSPSDGAAEPDDGAPLAEAETIGPKPPNAVVVFVCCETDDELKLPKASKLEPTDDAGC